LEGHNLVWISLAYLFPFLTANGQLLPTLQDTLPSPALFHPLCGVLLSLQRSYLAISIFSDHLIDALATSFNAPVHLLTRLPSFDALFLLLASFFNAAIWQLPHVRLHGRP
jgi:hypothetical protein